MILWIILIGGVGALLLAFMAMRGPSASKAAKRRMELLKERHGDVIAGAAQAAKLGKPVAEVASGKATAPFNALSTAVLSNTSEDAAGPEPKAAPGAATKSSLVGNLKSMLAKKEKAAA